MGRWGSSCRCSDSLEGRCSILSKSETKKKNIGTYVSFARQICVQCYFVLTDSNLSPLTDFLFFFFFKCYFFSLPLLLKLLRAALKQTMCFARHPQRMNLGLFLPTAAASSGNQSTLKHESDQGTQQLSPLHSNFLRAGSLKLEPACVWNTADQKKTYDKLMISAPTKRKNAEAAKHSPAKHVYDKNTLSDHLMTNCFHSSWRRFKKVLETFL